MGHIRVDPPNTNNKWVGFGLGNVDTFIIRVGFGLANVDTIHILTRHKYNLSTQIAIPNIYAKYRKMRGIRFESPIWRNL